MGGCNRRRGFLRAFRVLIPLRWNLRSQAASERPVPWTLGIFVFCLPLGCNIWRTCVSKWGLRGKSRPGAARVGTALAQGSQRGSPFYRANAWPFSGRYRGFILLLTFLIYTCYHMSRKPISIVKVRLGGKGKRQRCWSSSRNALGQNGLDSSPEPLSALVVGCPLPLGRRPIRGSFPQGFRHRRSFCMCSSG